MGIGLSVGLSTARGSTATPSPPPAYWLPGGFHFLFVGTASGPLIWS